MARRIQMHFLAIVALGGATAFAAPAAAPLSIAAVGARGEARAALERGVFAAQRILDVVRLAVVPGVGDPVAGWSLGATLPRYAAAETGDARRLESTREYARRTLAGAAPNRITPEALISLLRTDADQLLVSCDEAAHIAPAADVELRAAVADLRVFAALGRFHALRLAAAVHYNLFLRAQRLAELVSATYVEKEALQAWRDLMAAASAADRSAARVRPLRLAADWEADLVRLEASVRDLESQCCPPDPRLLREKIWRPAPVPSFPEPRVEVLPALGEASRVVLRMPPSAPAARASLLIRSRGDTVFREIPLAATLGGGLEAAVPASGPFEAFVEFDGPVGIRFAPAPWERPSLLTLGGS